LSPARAAVEVASCSRRLLWLLLFALLIAVLAASCERSSGQRHCQLGAEHTVALSQAKDFDGIALVAVPTSAVALWSEPSGLYAQRLSDEGEVQGARMRLGARCEGGFDALARERGFDAPARERVPGALARSDGQGAIDIACLLHPSRGKHDEPGTVLWLQLNLQLNEIGRRSIGEAGVLSEGVSLLRTPRGLELAWHDGAADVQRVWWIALEQPGAAPLQLSERGRIAAAPSLGLGPDGQSVVTWAETWVDGETLHSRIVDWTLARGVRALHDVGNYAAMPKLVALDRGLVLAFRDHREKEKIGLYVAKLGGQGLVDEPVRVGRADGTGRPAVTPCMRGLVSATPRTYGGDYFIGINWLDGTLVRSRGEQQFYEDSHAFTQVAASCQGEHALLFIAEFPQLQRETAALRAVSYHCP
jgi:hypothetical protein